MTKILRERTLSFDELPSRNPGDVMVAMIRAYQELPFEQDILLSYMTPDGLTELTVPRVDGDPVTDDWYGKCVAEHAGDKVITALILVLNALPMVTAGRCIEPNGHVWTADVAFGAPIDLVSAAVMENLQTNGQVLWGAAWEPFCALGGDHSDHDH